MNMKNVHGEIDIKEKSVDTNPPKMSCFWR